MNPSQYVSLDGLRDVLAEAQKRGWHQHTILEWRLMAAAIKHLIYTTSIAANADGAIHYGHAGYGEMEYLLGIRVKRLAEPYGDASVATLFNIRTQEYLHWNSGEISYHVPDVAVLARPDTITVAMFEEYGFAAKVIAGECEVTLTIDGISVSTKGDSGYIQNFHAHARRIPIYQVKKDNAYGGYLLNDWILGGVFSGAEALAVEWLPAPEEGAKHDANPTD
jgi:hypothetical protein